MKNALLKLNSVNTEDGEVLTYDGDVLEVGMEVFIDGEDGLTPAPDKEYTIGDDIVSVEGGKVITITARPIETEPEEVTETVETETETEPETEPEETEPETDEPTVDELKEIIEEQKKVIEDLNSQIEDLKKQLEEPAAEPVEDEFKKQEPEKNNKIDFSKYIKKRQ